MPTKKDYKELQEIWLQTNIQAHNFIPQSYWYKKLPFVKEALPQANIFYEGESPIKGFIGISEGYIEGLFVRKEFQHMGIGTLLIEKTKQNFNELSLSVYQKNESAIAFYQKMGFIIKQQNTQQETGEKEYFMTWNR